MTARGSRPDASERRPADGSRLAAFGEMLVVGLGVTLMSLPLVTVVPALAAGARHLDDHVSGERDTVGGLLRHGRQAIRSGWPFGLCVLVVSVMLCLNIALGVQALVPGGTAFAILSGVLLSAVLVVACRVAALWRPGASWRSLWRSGRTLTLEDPVGSVFVLLGLGVSATVVWMLPPLIVIAPGLVAVALVAAERRRAHLEPAEGHPWSRHPG